MKVLPDGRKITRCNKCDSPWSADVEDEFDEVSVYCGRLNRELNHMELFWSIPDDCPLPDAEVGE